MSENWFTRLLERWEEVQQRIDKLPASGASEAGASAPETAKDATAEEPNRSITPEKMQ